MEAQKKLPEPRKVDAPSLKTSSEAPPAVTTAVVSTPHLGALSVLTKALAASPSAPTLSVIVPTTSSVPGGTVLVSAQHASSTTGLLKPPPLIATVSASGPGPSTLATTNVSSKPHITIYKASDDIKAKVSQASSTISSLAGIIKKSSGGLGAGKPKAFLALMASAAKKQPTKKTPGTSKAVKGQGNKNKPSSTFTPSKKIEQQVPSRTSNRSIKRPRTYDEDLDDLKAVKLSSSKKAKGTPKILKSLGRKSTPASGVKDLGRWRPTDDLMLISAVQQTNDLNAVHLGVNFSCRFTLQEVEERWHALLYSPCISQLAVEAMKALHPGVVTMALNNALWSQEEEAVLARIPTTDPGHLEKFQSVLKENPAVFHTCRTATSLHHHWVLMGHNGLLNNQKVDLIPPEENIKEFADAEDHLEDSELVRPRDVREEALEQELVASDRQAKMEIMKLEEELPLWRTVIDTGSSPDFGANDFALLKGKVVEFRMSKRTVVLGRSTVDNVVDFDLSLEAPAFKISRRQATIQLNDNGEFIVHNEGRRAMYVSGKAVVSKSYSRLLHNQVLEVASMSFLVLLNTKLATSVKNASASTSNTS